MAYPFYKHSTGRLNSWTTSASLQHGGPHHIPQLSLAFSVRRNKIYLCIFHKSYELHHSLSPAREIPFRTQCQTKPCSCGLGGILLPNNELLFSLPGSWAQLLYSVPATMSTLTVSGGPFFISFYSSFAPYPLIFTLVTLLYKIIFISYLNTGYLQHF